MSRSWGRGQVEPTAALASVVALTVALAAYGGAFADGLPRTTSDDAPSELTRVAGAVTAGGVVRPAALAGLDELGASGRGVNVTLRADGRVWAVGPPRPSRDAARHADARADAAVRPVAVETRTGRIRPGRLRVVVW